jgi:hypothetical protein
MMSPEELTSELREATTRTNFQLQDTGNSDDDGGSYNPSSSDDENDENGNQAPPADPLEHDSDNSDDDDDSDSSTTTQIAVVQQESKKTLDDWSTAYRKGCTLNMQATLRVYVMADKNDVPALQLLARQTFKHIAESHWETCEDFTAVISEVYATTMPGDPLRNLVCCPVTDQYATDANLRRDLRPAILGQHDFAVGLLDMTVELRHTEWRVQGLDGWT